MTTAYDRPKQRDSQGKPLKNIANTRLYKIWESMHTRCYNQKHQAYQWYGAKGITICKEWNIDNINGYYNFRAWAMENGYNDTLTIDRIDPNGNYEPMNCRWTDDTTQARNRTSNRPITVNGTTYTNLAEACEALNRTEDYTTIHLRITRYGYTAQEAFDKPITWNFNAKQITIDGKTYKSIAEACRALNLNRKTVCTYQSKHHTTTEEAIAHYMVSLPDEE